MHSDERLFGHVFIVSLYLYGYCKAESMLKKAELNKTLTPSNLLFEFVKM